MLDPRILQLLNKLSDKEITVNEFKLFVSEYAKELQLRKNDLMISVENMNITMVKLKSQIDGINASEMTLLKILDALNNNLERNQKETTIVSNDGTSEVGS